MTLDPLPLWRRRDVVVVVVVNWAMRDLASLDRGKCAVISCEALTLRLTVGGLEAITPPFAAGGLEAITPPARGERELSDPSSARPGRGGLSILIPPGFLLDKVSHRACQALLTKRKAHWSMLRSGMRSSTGPPSMNNALPASSNSSKNSPPQPIRR